MSDVKMHDPRMNGGVLAAYVAMEMFQSPAPRLVVAFLSVCLTCNLLRLYQHATQR